MSPRREIRLITAHPHVRRVITALIAAPVLMILGTAGTVFAFPVAGAVACPTCYGLELLDANTFVEKSMATAARTHVAEVLAEGRNRVRAFYGSINAGAYILVCRTERCYQRLGGRGARGSSFLDLTLRLSSRGIDPVIASHELSHIELHHRLGRLHFLIGAVPAWFDEGIAVIVSDDPRYLAPAGNPDRCLVRSDEPLPTGMLEWNRRAGEDNQLYAKAACRVSEWISARDGGAAVKRLLGRISRGTPFEAAYAVSQ